MAYIVGTPGKTVGFNFSICLYMVAGKVNYYIIPNDVIVVEPLKAISSSYSNITYTTVLSSITTLIDILLFTSVSF